MHRAASHSVFRRIEPAIGLVVHQLAVAGETRPRAGYALAAISRAKKSSIRANPVREADFIGLASGKGAAMAALKAMAAIAAAVMPRALTCTSRSSGSFSLVAAINVRPHRMHKITPGTERASDTRCAALHEMHSQKLARSG